MTLEPRVAWHEAAHVLIARRVGVPVLSVSLSAFSAGTMHSTPIGPDPSPVEIERRLTVVLAGELAEGYAPAASANGREPESDDPWFSDAETLAQLHIGDAHAGPRDADVVAHYEPRIGAEAVARARAFAAEFVSCEAATGRLEKVATALLRRQHLDAAEIDSLIEGET